MSERPNPKPRSRPGRGRPLDVAIVGMACRFPGARDLAEFWKNIRTARDCTRDVAADRWDSSVFYDPLSTANDRVYCRRGGYLDPPIDFDAARYGIMPLAVEGGEPEQFLILDAARLALEDAGLASGVPVGRRVEVVIGRGNYFNRGNLTRLQHGRIVAQTLSILRALHPTWSDADLESVRRDLKASLPPFEAGTIPGQITNAVSGRVAARLDLTGASYVVDAASASSLVALDLGARALVERRADMAIVGGVYLQPDVDFPMVFTRLGALSKRGDARPFSNSADGTLPGEGVGVIILKRLADAERDRDRVYAVVKGVGLASDGRGSSLAAPSAKGHARAMRRAYRSSGIAPETVDLIEGHGLGVPASDRSSGDCALRSSWGFLDDRAPRVPSLVHLEALIGHAMPAAGMAGLIKTGRRLHFITARPPADTARRPDPHPLPGRRRDESPLQRSNPRRRAAADPRGDDRHPRRAGVNAFGFAGINAHAVLEEHSPSADSAAPGCMPDWETEVILLGTRDRAQSIELSQALIAWLESGENQRVSIKDLAYTLNTGQGDFPFRVGLVVESTADLCKQLIALVKRLEDPSCRSIRDARGIYFWDEPLAGPGRIAFLFPGEGSQYPGMLADLCPHFPELRTVLDTSDRIALARREEILPSQHLFGASKGDGLWGIETAVNVVLSSQWAIYQLLSRLALKPDAVVGHSSGEILALASAGVFKTDKELEDRLGELGSILGDLESAGKVPSASLVAVAADRSRVEMACREAGGSVEIAIDNCPHQVVMSGEPAEIEAVVARLRAQGILFEPLPFHRAYHSPRFASALDPIRDFFRELTLERPTAPVYSCAVARPMGDDVETIRRLAVEQWISPVAFRSTIEAMHADGVRLFVEVGARGNLTGFVEDTLRGRPHFAIAANVPRRTGLTQLNHLVAALYAQGVSLRPDHLYARRRPCRIDLSAEFKPSRPGPSLAVGFPEMKLSNALIDRLRQAPALEPAGPDVPHSRSDRNGFMNATHSSSPGHPKAPSNGHSPAAPRGDDGLRTKAARTATQTHPQPVNRAFARAAAPGRDGGFQRRGRHRLLRDDGPLPRNPAPGHGGLSWRRAGDRPGFTCHRATIKWSCQPSRIRFPFGRGACRRTGARRGSRAGE